MKKKLIIIGLLILIILIYSFIYWFQFLRPKTEVSIPALTPQEETEGELPSLPSFIESETSILTPVGEEPIEGGLGKPPQSK